MNIYVPKIPLENQQKLPVMFWIYGGSFTGGSNLIESYDPEYFMDTSEVILVSVNYRLGPLGFLKLPNSTVTGNVGLTDQLLALEWVNHHIDKFAGNADSITVFGESAGGHSVNLLVLSPLSDGLFHRAIMQSGTVSDPGWSQIQPEYANQYGLMLAEKLDCLYDDMDITLECIQSKSLDEIIGTYVIGGNLWMPTVDGSFIPEDPRFILEKGNFNKNVEIIVGNVADEGLGGVLPLVIDPSGWSEFQDNFRANAPRKFLNIPYTRNFTDEDHYKAEEIVKYYVGSYDNMNEENMAKIIEMFSDDTIFGAYKTAKSFANHGVETYQFIVSYEGQYSTSQYWYGVDPMGVNHGDDLFYLFQMPKYDITLTGVDVEVKNVMIKNWVNFAIHGNPTPDDETGMKWTPLAANDSFKSIFWNIYGPVPEMEDSLYFQEKMKFWENLLN